MECAGWLQKSVHERHCELTHTPSHSEDMRSCGQERVHFSTADTPKDNLPVSQRPGRERRYQSHAQWCETPKLTKKDVCLRRRLLGAKSMTDLKTSVSWTPSCGDTYTPGVSESPDVLLGGLLSYSTLKSDGPSESCMKRRLVFSQAVTSTLEDGRGGVSPSLSDPDLDETIISGLLLSDTPEAARGHDGFRTPVTSLSADLSESLSVLSTPSHTPLSRLDVSEDSGFGSLRLDISEQGCDDGSFQEGAPRATLGRDRRRSRLEHQRRLSTLREGSQSDDEVKGQRLKGRGLMLDEEVFAKTPPLMATQQDLSTPALQAMEALSRSFTLSHDLDQPTSTCLNPSHNLHQPIATFLPLSHLIGRKMGLGRMDVLTELHVRNLHHVLSSILQLLSARDIHTCTQVRDSWSAIILQDRNANRRRKMYEREQKRVLKMGGTACVVDAETRLALACRMALSRVQAQAKTPSARAHTPATAGARAHTPATAGPRAHTPATAGARAHTPATAGARAHTPATAGARAHTPATAGARAHTPATAGARAHTPATAGARAHTPATAGARAHTPATAGARAHTPATAGARAHTPPSTKRQQFLQVAKTLFSDECLRPCPRCERPARCHSVKAEGVCSWSECVFHFCTSCLRAYHGSADCTRLPNMHTRRKGRSQLLPGSAQSKRNVKRL